MWKIKEETFTAMKGLLCAAHKKKLKNIKKIKII